MHNNQVVEALLYTSLDEYSSVSQNYIHMGVFYHSLLQLRYDGLLINNVCDSYGTFTLCGKKIYEGEVRCGVPHGKGTVYSMKTGNVLYIGTILEGVPKYGVCFSIPAIYEGFFYFNQDGTEYDESPEVTPKAAQRLSTKGSPSPMGRSTPLHFGGSQLKGEENAHIKKYFEFD